MNPAFISPPTRIPVLLRLALWAAEKVAGRQLLPPRLLAWYPKAAISSGILEALIAHGEGRINQRVLKLVRMAVSFAVNCPFCMDMNSSGWNTLMTPEELSALQGCKALEDVASFSELERLAIEYAGLASQTPLAFTPAFGERLRAIFSEREIVILATTAAQVNYWARLIQALGCPPAGVTPDLNLYLDIGGESGKCYINSLG